MTGDLSASMESLDEGQLFFFWNIWKHCKNISIRYTVRKESLKIIKRKISFNSFTMIDDWYKNINIYSYSNKKIWHAFDIWL